jgi:hypothetical protein
MFRVFSLQRSQLADMAVRAPTFLPLGEVAAQS